MGSKDDDTMCHDSKCPVEPIVGGHTAGISASGPAGNAECSDKE